jgi:CHAT domain-containing protein/tetratricopeptide (TPR) repeat protein
MSDYQIEDETRLLALCALMPFFDNRYLRELSVVDTLVIETLLSDERVITHPMHSNSYRLREDVANGVLDYLRNQHPEDETAIHAHIFRTIAGLLRRQPDEYTVLDEDIFLHHFDNLCSIHATNMQWSTIRTYVTEAQSIPLRGRRHLQYVAFFDAYTAIRLQDYAYGEAILDDLLQQENLEADLRLKAWRGLATAAFYRTHFDRALELNQQVLAYAQSTGNRMYEGLALLNLAVIYMELEEYRQALIFCLQSLRVFHHLRNWSYEVSALYHAGILSMYLGRWIHAEEYSARATTIYEQHGMLGHLGFIYWQRGYLRHILGDEAASEAAYLRALPLAESAQYGQPSLAMDVHLYLGLLYQTQNRWDAALRYYDRALVIAAQLDRQHQICFIHYRRGQAFQQQGRLAEALEAFQAAIDGIETLGSATQGEDVKISLFGTTQQLYEATVLLLLELGRPTDAFHYVERARSRAFLDSLAKKSPELSAALARPVVTLADVQAQLPPDALLLEYYTTGVLPRGEHLINSIPDSNTRLRAHLTLPPQVILFAIAHDRFEVLRPALNPNSLRPQIGDRYPGRHLLHGRLPQHLYERLLAPAADLQAGKSTLYLVPHGPLHYVPFTALRSAAGKYLIHSGGPAVAHATSATILMRRCLGRPPTQATGILAIGFDDPLGEQPLHYAEAEARHVARLLGGEAWTGTEPKSARLIEAGQQLRWLHIAGHARFKPEDPLGSDLYLGQDDALDARAIIRDLTLAADLVTLSSCTSGVTHVVPGDELRGLQRALVFAGAPTVVCTRWEARDLVALLIMDYFYKRLRAGYAPAAALRDAQVAVREMTVQELGALFETWYATGDELATALGAPAAALQETRATTRELGGPVHSTLLDSLADSPDLRPFADPILWAPFMVVGRA